MGLWTASDGGTTLLFGWHPPNSVFRFWTTGNYRNSTLPVESVSSFHEGGANVLFGDGTVRFVKDSISSWPLDPKFLMPVGIQYVPNGWLNVPRPGVWQAIMTRAGEKSLASSSCLVGRFQGRTDALYSDGDS